MQNRLPNSKDAEMILLGCMLSAQSHNDLACQTLIPEDFYCPHNRVIFSTMQEMYKQGISPEMNLLIIQLKNSNAIQEIPSIEYLYACLNSASTSYEIDDYTDIIINKSICRKLISSSLTVVNEAQHPDVDIVQTIVDFQDKLYSLTKKKMAVDPLTISEIVKGSAPKNVKSLVEIQRERIRDRLDYPNRKCSGISSGIDELDAAINGFLPEHLVILAARPGVGKTTLALNIVVDIAVMQKIPCAFFSLEMSAEQLAFKIVCSYGNIDQNRISQCDPTALPEFKDACEKVQNSPLHIVDKAYLGIQEIKLTLKKLIDTNQIKFVVIDYLQLLKGSDKFKNSDSRVNEVSDISRNLKLLAKELKIPILCLAQLNRAIEARANKQPLLSDLRESGAIEQDADEILMLHRPDLYDKNDSPGKFEIHIRKNRFKEPKTINLCFDASCGNFESYAVGQSEAIKDVHQRLNGG